MLEYSLPTPNSGPYGLAEGPDGNMWIVEQTANKIARMKPDGSSFTEYPIPTPNSRSWGITLGPDGNMWFTEGDGNKIGKFSVPATISGTISVTEYPVPTAGASPFQIAPGPDGNVWFTETLVDKIGKITPSGAVTEFALPTQPAYPYGITTGSDGNIWFTEYLSNKIGRVTPSGVFTEFPIPTPNSFPFGIASASTGELWFTEQGAGQLGAITTNGVIAEFPTGSASSGPSGIVSLAQPTHAPSTSRDGARQRATSLKPAEADQEDDEDESRDLGAVSPDGYITNQWHYRNLPFNPGGQCDQTFASANKGTGITRFCVACPTCKQTCDLWGAPLKDRKLGWTKLAQQGEPFAGAAHLEIYCACAPSPASSAAKSSLVAADTPSFIYDPLAIPIPTASSGAYVIAAGPHGRYFTEMNANKIGRIVRSIAVNPLYQQTSAGTPAVFTLRDLAVTGPVNLSATITDSGGSPADSSITLSIDPTSLNQNGSATLTVNTNSNSPQGDYGILVTATSPDGYRLVNMALTIAGPDFSLGFDSATVTAQAGTKARVVVNITRTGGFAGNVTITPPAPANGIRSKPSDPIATTGSSVVFKIKVGPAVAPGQYPVTFTGQDDSGRTHQATVTIVVQ